ncbi:hypothetical protein Cantr_04666 [Candida viswanathii]|uniref:Uncharacterized protein n=1 Tax=Candida viswanathii TaxID=5486 RepID=A0A367XP82_9ASCO|nr:hypothetical protein Cantr_04666 [Candida viswanathii]
MSSKVEVQTATTASPSISPPESVKAADRATAPTTTPPLGDHPATNSLKRKNSSTSSPPRSTTSTINSTSNSTVSAPVSTSTTSPPKRHRPLSLNLGVPDNADLALRIVSPGLPPSINEAMKSTIQLLKQIQQQQKNLIAARHSKDLDDTDDQQAGTATSTTTTTATTTTTTVIQPSQPQLPPPNLRLPPKSPVYASDDSDLNRLSGVKKLKRLNVPPPLSIGEGAPSTTNVGNLRPSIHSAPIRSRPRPRMVPGAPRMVPQMQQLPPNLIPIQQPHYYYATTPYQQYYSPSVQHHPMQQQLQHVPLPRSQLRQVNPRVRMIPLTATATHFGRRANLQGTQIQQHQQPQVIVQAPSVQQQQQQQVQAQGQGNKPKANAVTDVFHGDLHKAAPFNSQPLSAQREYFGGSVHDEAPTPQVLTINEQEDEENTDVAGSITINGSNVFNFKIFNKNKGKSNDDETIEEDDENIEEYNKKKFLKICETCWNQVFKKDD